MCKNSLTPSYLNQLGFQLNLSIRESEVHIRYRTRSTNNFLFDIIKMMNNNYKMYRAFYVWFSFFWRGIICQDASHLCVWFEKKGSRHESHKVLCYSFWKALMEIRIDADFASIDTNARECKEKWDVRVTWLV